MKKILLFILCLAGLFSTKLNAQTFSIADTVWQTVPDGTSATIPDYITNHTTGTLNLKWVVISSSFPADWANDTALSICDDQLCRTNSGGVLWNGTTGTTYTAAYYGNSAADSVGDFHMVLNLTYATEYGPYYLTVRVTDFTGSIGGYSKASTFAINTIPAAITNVNNSESDIVLYPNPAKNDATLSFNLSAASNVQVQIVDELGKVVNVAANENMATGGHTVIINTEALASGVYNIMIHTEGGVATQRLSVVK